jgi:hypothetical protein
VPRSSSWPRIAPPQVCVVDTCSLANMKRADVLRANERFAFFRSDDADAVRWSRGLSEAGRV